MNDLISRQEAIETAIRMADRIDTGDILDYRDVLVECFKVLPSAPKKGKWKPFDLTWGRSVWACDACGETVDVPTLNGKPIFDYCPWCGARMEAE